MFNRLLVLFSCAQTTHRDFFREADDVAKLPGIVSLFNPQVLLSIKGEKNANKTFPPPIMKSVEICRSQNSNKLLLPVKKFVQSIFKQ